MEKSLPSYLLVSSKDWHDALFDELSQTDDQNWKRIKTIEEFTYKHIKELNPTKIFIPHWSHAISEAIYTNWECIIFHMTDLPYGRGGSPLQNLIALGHKATKISALRAEKGIDTGDLYIKKDLDLSGTAKEIFLRSKPIIKEMILEIINNNIQPTPQAGEIFQFKRRKPEEGNLNYLNTLNEVYDFIRMLDCEGYPPAFLETKSFKFEFKKASYKEDYIDAHVRIFKK